MVFGDRLPRTRNREGEPVTYQRIPEVHGRGRLGRHVNHDPRSLSFRVGRPVGALVSVLHERVTPVFDQGDLGSCTGNAAVGALGTAPLFAALPADHATLDESLAVAVYQDATQLDPFPGAYPPDDTGSDGLSAAKALKARGLISGYLHATDLVSMQAALQATPVIVGVNWYSGFDSPDSSGRVRVSGSVRGGHEFEVIGMDMTTGMFTAVNSWGASWGVNGRFKFSFTDMTRLFSEQGDCTQLLPLTAPVPTPTPPTPAPADRDLTVWWSKSSTWAASPHVGANRAAAKAAADLAKAKGLT
jgi:hypothetical protein